MELYMTDLTNSHSRTANHTTNTSKLPFAMKEIVIIQQNYQKASREARNITSAFSVLVFFSDVPFTDIITPSLPYFTHSPYPESSCKEPPINNQETTM